MLVFGGPGGPWEADAAADADVETGGESHHEDADDGEDAAGADDAVGDDAVGDDAVGEVFGEVVGEAVDDEGVGVGCGSAPAAPTDIAQPATRSALTVSPPTASVDLKAMEQAYRVRTCDIMAASPNPLPWFSSGKA